MSHGNTSEADTDDDRYTEPFSSKEDAMQYQREHWREDLELLNSELDASMNFRVATPHSSRDGLEGYHLHFGGRWLWERVTDAIEELGFKIVAMRTESYRDNASFLVLVRRTRPPAMRELQRIDADPDE